MTAGIIDAHCHIASEEIIPPSFVAGAIDNMFALLVAQGVPVTREKLAAIYRQKLQDPLCDALVAEMDAAGIAKSILLIPDFTLALKDCALTIEEAYERHRAVLARHPGRFEVFGGIDPRWGKSGIDLFERSLAELGFGGLKLYPPCGFSPSDAALFPLYEICARYGAPVVVHVGPTSPALSFTTTYPFLVDEAARLFPSVNFILAHGSVSFVEECAMLCAFRPNVFLDLSAFQTALRKDGDASVVRAIAARGINHKILFGTDWPVFRLQGDQQNFVEAVAGEDGALSDVNAADRALILHGNAERLLAQRTCT